MTVKEAILTLNANVVLACERAGFDSATVQMIEDALDTIEDALQAGKPRLMKLEEVKEYANAGRPFYLEYMRGPFGWTVPSEADKYGFKHGNGQSPSLKQFYGYYNRIVFEGSIYRGFRCWTSQPTQEQREMTLWE